MIQQVTVRSRGSQKSSAKNNQCNVYLYIIVCNYTHAPGNYHLWLLDPSRVIRHMVIQQKAKPTSMRKAKWLLFRNVVCILWENIQAQSAVLFFFFSLKVETKKTMASSVSCRSSTSHVCSAFCKPRLIFMDCNPGARMQHLQVMPFFDMGCPSPAE